jgi:hypothetical protein
MDHHMEDVQSLDEVCQQEQHQDDQYDEQPQEDKHDLQHDNHNHNQQREQPGFTEQDSLTAMIDQARAAREEIIYRKLELAAMKAEIKAAEEIRKRKREFEIMRMEKDDGLFQPLEAIMGEILKRQKLNL